MPGMPRQNTQLFKLTSGEPDTLRGVRPVRREAFGNLPQQYGKALGAYPTADQSCPHPLRHYRQPGGRAYGAQLFQVPFRRRVPGDAYLCMAIYAVLVQGIAAGDDMMGPSGPVWGKRCCCVSFSSRPGASRNPYGALTKIPL